MTCMTNCCLVRGSWLMRSTCNCSLPTGPRLLACVRALSLLDGDVRHVGDHREAGHLDTPAPDGLLETPSPEVGRISMRTLLHCPLPRRPVQPT